MQAKSSRTNPERSEAMRAALLAAGRTLFVEKGYAGTGTPEIAAAAGATRGALYHHFRDKQDLFAAIVAAEAEAVAAEIEAGESRDDGLAAVLAGSRAYFAAMAVPGRTRLLLLEAPAVLGSDAADALDRAHARRTLAEGLAALVGTAPPELDALADLFSAAFDRAALAIEAGAELEVYVAALERMLRGLKPA